MDPIQEAVEYSNSREPGDNFSYRKVAKKFRFNRTTLSRRHRGAQRSRRDQARHQLSLNPQQDDKLLGYIERCTRDGLPPTRSVLKNFSSAVAQQEVSNS
ncbi:uncharacterized protein SETTUDRAFT_111395 [Exserohilum turcica Et28A]|uniref:HTH CENPB-type domain-containing protein n=1 Tax=Exserohilum turcicum (strain 28A) TaxID=671987 RepID=R0JXS0_EXST2|nr:uncharacterized protein SETTUDRAFT_111395 [Exserohilum turcica Et28A]EOA85713.1 hypothetical protein SETTUDRAFT_111395 [Exserohilum turcica Et28A]